MYLIENAILKVWTASPRGLNISYSSAALEAWGLRISWLRLVLLGLALLSALVVFVFLKKTRLGTAVRAASEDMEATTLQGINSVWVCAISFAVGIGLAGVAGVGMATVYSFDYQFGFTFAIKALIALALGGLGNVFGALAGRPYLGRDREPHGLLREHQLDRSRLVRGVHPGAHLPAAGPVRQAGTG